MVLSMTKYQDLIDKVRACGGPDRELDAALATTVGGYVFEKRDRDRKEWFYPIDGRSGRKDLHGAYGALLRYTASIDAALALAKAKRGDNWFSILLDAMSDFGAAGTLGPEHLARFIVLHTLLALQSNEATNVEDK